MGCGEAIAIGERPLHVALGAGHHNATGGNPVEIGLTGTICRAVVDLARRSDGIAVRGYTPDDGLGTHPGPVDVGPREVATTWDPIWTVDILHEIHVQAVPAYPAARGVFVIYPDWTVDADTVDCDADVRDLGPALSAWIAVATGLPVGGPHGLGVMSERETLLGKRGQRLRIFAATATPAMRAHSCRFISEIGCHTNVADAALLFAPDFPDRAAVGILDAYAALATARMGWSYPYHAGEGWPNPDICRG
jgi:hypothetical protein